MNRIVLLIGLLISTHGVNSQDFKGAKKIVTLNYTDTLEIKRFNNQSNLIFHKIFPQYGISQILGYDYVGDKKVSYTWSHSNIGFVETEYEFDSLNNTFSAYSYRSDKNIPIKNLMQYNSIESLKSSWEFKKYHNLDMRYLKSIQYMKDSLVIKEDEYNESLQLKTTTYFTYDGGKLISEKKTNSGDESEYQELIYEYDINGNEIKWAKVYNSTDTSIVYRKRYLNNSLIEETGFIGGELDSRTTFDYEGDRLITKKQFNNKGELKISSKCSYRFDGKIDYIDEVNNYMGQKKKIIYLY